MKRYVQQRHIRYFSMFSGIGGFELGIEQAAHELGLTSECVGYSEIDKPAIKTYEEHFDHHNYGDATTIDADSLPDFDLLVGGFPCQSFSIAGKRLGFEETRGTLFFDIARVIKAREPKHFILENVKGLLSHNGGQTLRTIIRTLDELGYDLQWQVLNSKDHGVPQNRERIYIVGNLGGTPRPEVFPFTDEGNPYSTIGFSTETAVARTLTAGGNSGGNHSGMTIIVDPTPLGGAVDGMPDEEVFGATRDNRTGNLEYREKAVANTINSTYSTGIDKRSQRTVIAALRNGETELVTRRLTPTECERLQGFPDGWTVGSDTQRYKQCGNAVTVNVVRDVAKRLLESWQVEA